MSRWLAVTPDQVGTGFFWAAAVVVVAAAAVFVGYATWYMVDEARDYVGGVVACIAATVIGFLLIGATLKGGAHVAWTVILQVILLAIWVGAAVSWIGQYKDYRRGVRSRTVTPPAVQVPPPVPGKSQEFRAPGEPFGPPARSGP